MYMKQNSDLDPQYMVYMYHFVVKYVGTMYFSILHKAIQVQLANTKECPQKWIFVECFLCKFLVLIVFICLGQIFEEQ